MLERCIVWATDGSFFFLFLLEREVVLIAEDKDGGEGKRPTVLIELRESVHARTFHQTYCETLASPRMQEPRSWPATACQERVRGPLLSDWGLVVEGPDAGGDRKKNVERRFVLRSIDDCRGQLL